MPESKPTWKRGIQTFAIILILVIFPLVSWYFLQSGFNFTKDKFEQLDSLGQVQGIVFPIQDQKDFKIDHWKGNIVLTAHLTKASKAELDIIESLYNKFDERSDLFFLFYDHETTEYATDSLFKNYTFYKDNNQVKIIDAQTMQTEEFYEAFNLSQLQNSSEFILIDTGNEVRGVYNILDEKDRDLMITHIIFLLPKE